MPICNDYSVFKLVNVSIFSSLSFKDAISQ